MASYKKEYQNVSFNELMLYSDKNPNRNRTLASIEIQTIKSTQDTTLEKIGLNGYSALNLNPTGIVSLYACIQDPINYSLSAKGSRLQTIIEYTTKLQEQSDELKNTHLSRKRKKIYDLIGASYNGAIFEDKDYITLFSGISLLRNIHFILMKSSVQESIEEGEKQYDSSLKGEIVFSSDPSTWKRENPIWIVDYRARWIALPMDSKAQDIHKILALWISTVEKSGWVIQWPEIDATKTELVEKLSLFPTWQLTDKKLSKDVLAARLGRTNAINVFTNWMTDSTSGLI